MLRSLVRSVAAATMAALWAGSSFAAEPLNEINISYVESPFNLQAIVMRKQELLEKEFAADGVKINWHNITSGAQQTQEFGDLATLPGLSIECRQTVQQLGLNGWYADQIDQRQGADPRCRQGIADDMRMRRPCIDIPHPGIAQQQRPQTQGRDGVDGPPERVQAIVRRGESVLRQGEIDRHPAYRCAAGQDARTVR